MTLAMHREWIAREAIATDEGQSTLATQARAQAAALAAEAASYEAELAAAHALLDKWRAPGAGAA